MRPVIKALLFTLAAVIFVQCEKEYPNENWIPGGYWIDSRDGNSYATIPIGDQVWLAENMAYLPSVYNISDGSEDNGNEDNPFYYVLDYDGTNVSSAKKESSYKTYGVYYNWNAALSACPDGWHLPTDDDWKELEIFLGMDQDQVVLTGLRGTDEGRRLKSTSGWDNNGNGTNEIGFTALPGGYRFIISDGLFANSGVAGDWWSATEFTDKRFGLSRKIQFSDDGVLRLAMSKDFGLSVRCIKDE